MQQQKIHEQFGIRYNLKKIGMQQQKIREQFGM